MALLLIMLLGFCMFILETEFDTSQTMSLILRANQPPWLLYLSP